MSDSMNYSTMTDACKDWICQQRIQVCLEVSIIDAVRFCEILDNSALPTLLQGDVTTMKMAIYFGKAVEDKIQKLRGEWEAKNVIGNSESETGTESDSGERSEWDINNPDG